VRRDRALALLAAVAEGRVPVADALEQLSHAPFEEVGAAGNGPAFATVDGHRALRQGYPEVVFGEGKSPEQCVAICERLAPRGDGFLVTRAASGALAALTARFADVEVNEVARTAYLAPAQPMPRASGTACVVTAGTTDLPVAEECAVTLAASGVRVRRITDVGVAGVHRVLAQLPALADSAVAIVIAGMDGALPSVVGGLLRTPVIAVPTSVGYGVAFSGVAPLLTMLNSCAAGVTVVNIDNGFGAAMAAVRILRGAAEKMEDVSERNAQLDNALSVGSSPAT
jgi:pyridinium-3,5-biscarboxylic acid mononucleotide synthase